MHRYLTLCFFVLVACGGAKKPAQDAESLPNEPAVNASESDGGENGGSGTGGGSNSGGENAPVGEVPKRTSEVREKDAQSGNTYDKENTEVVLARAARQVKSNCGAAKDEEGKATGPWGKVMVKVTLGHNGHAKTVAVPPSHEGKPAGKCIANAFSILIFPPWSGQDADVDWEVELIPPAAAAAKPGKK
jgi:hypothetical protein